VILAAAAVDVLIRNGGAGGLAEKSYIEKVGWRRAMAASHTP
jgi:hypothetical protein